MAYGDGPTKVSLETSLDDNDLTIDKLAIFFEKLQEHYEILKVQNKKVEKRK